MTCLLANPTGLARIAGGNLRIGTDTAKQEQMPDGKAGHLYRLVQSGTKAIPPSSIRARRRPAPLTTGTPVHFILSTGG